MRRASRRPKATLSKIDIGNGVGFWNTMPTRKRRLATSTLGARMFSPSSSTSPVARCPGYSAYMRLSTRSSVDLPQPEGPMKAVMLPVREREVDVLQRLRARRRRKSRWRTSNFTGLSARGAQRLSGALDLPGRSSLARRVQRAETTMRATMLRIRMLTVISSAPDQASCCQSL